MGRARKGPAFKEPEFDQWGVRLVDVAPKPYRYGLTSDIILETDRAILVDYHTWRLWLPKWAVRRDVSGQLFSRIDVIEQSKAHESAERISR